MYNHLTVSITQHRLFFINSPSQSSQPGSASMGGQYASQGVSSSPVFEQQRPSASPALEQPQSSPSAAGSLLGGGLSAPATTQQICSCITIHPAAPSSVQQSPAASLAPAADSFAPSAASSAAQQQQQQTFSAPQQSFAPAAAQQQQAYAPAQSGPAQGSNGRY